MGKKQSLNGFNPDEFEVISEPSDNFNPSEFKVLSTPSPTKQVFEPSTPKFTPDAPNVDEILSNLKTNNDNEKQIIKNIAIASHEGKAKPEDVTNAILTFQGQHHNQEGGKRYYMTEENGIYKPVPLGKQEQPPKDKNVASIFEDSSWYEDLGNSIKSGAEKLGASLLRTPAFIADMPGMTAIPTDVVLEGKVIGKMPNVSEQLSKDLGMGEKNLWAEHLEKKATDAKAQINQKYDQGITDYISQGEYSKAVGALSNAVAESLPVTLSLIAGNAAGMTGTASTLLGGAVFGAEKKQELEGENLTENKKNAIALGYGLAEGFFEQFGITKLGSITNQVLKKEGKDAAKIFAEKAFKDVYAKPLVNLVGTLGEEAAGEAATQFAQNAIDKYSGYQPDKDLTEGVVDAALVGMGSAVGFAGVAKTFEKKRDLELEKQNEQSRVAFDISQKGTDAINSFKADIDNSVKTGEIRPKKAEEAKFLVDMFADYHNQTNDLRLDNESKRKVFDYTFAKSNIESQIKNLDPEKMNGIERAKYEGLKTQAKHLQEDINKIVLEAQIKDETTVADKTIEGQTKLAIKPDKEKKEGEKPLPTFLQSLTDKYKPKEEGKVTEERSYTEIPKGEFNHRNYIARVKHAKLAEHIESLPNKQMEGKIIRRDYAEPGGKVNRVFEIELNDGKRIRFASSRELESGISGHFRIEHAQGRPEELPVGVKIEYLPSGKKVIKAFNAKTGKFLGFAKETLKGKSEYTDKDIDQLEHIGTIVEQPILPSDENEEDEGPIEPVSPRTPKTPLQPFSKSNVEVKHEKETINREGLTTENTEEVTPKGEIKNRKLVTGTKKANRKIRHPEKKLALKHEIFTPHGLAMQYFIGGGEVNPNSIKKLFKGSNSEVRARISYVRKDAPTIENIAEDIVAQNDLLDLDYNDVVNAVEEIVMTHNSSTSMAKDLNKSMTDKEERFAPLEEVVNDESEIADEKGYAEEFDNALDLLEGMTDDELTALANQQEEFDNWYDDNENKIEIGNDIIIRDDLEGDQFQKPKESIKQGNDIQTGKPVTINWIKNTEPVANMGSRFGQDVEPTGSYISQKETNLPLGDKWIEGSVTLSNPLVIPVTTDTLIEWKRDLSKKYGKKGKTLTKALEAEGYDGIITKNTEGSFKGMTGEIIVFNRDKINLNIGEQKNLVVLHNISEKKLANIDKLGGLPAPSLAITKPEIPFEGFGDITLIGNSSLGDPKSYKNKIFNADVYSPRYPSVEVKFKDFAQGRKFEAELLKLSDEYGIKGGYIDLDETLKGYGNQYVKAAYLQEKGIKLKPKKGDDLSDAIRQYFYVGKNELDLNEWINEKVSKYEIVERIFKGFTNMGSRQYVPHNLDTVVRILTKAALRGGEGFNYGAGNIRAMAAKQFKTVKELKAHHESLISKENFEKIKEETNSELLDIVEELRGKYTAGGSNQFTNTDNITELIGDYANGDRKALSEEFFKGLTNKDFEMVNDYLTKLRNLPTEYFEAKPQRAVYLNEFTAAVVPKGISEQTKNTLQKNNVQIYEYDAKIKGDRQRAIKQAAKEQNSLFQKAKTDKGNLEAEHHKNVQKVIETMQKAMPKVKMVYNKTLKAAGVLRKDGTIEINPYYAGLDTPIHEAGHVLIDAMGYNNRIIQAAIKQLKSTELWTETKARYPELNEEMLGKEVLAEAIGREGADIFKEETEKSKFKQYLNYIFNWFKRNLGLDKMIAKSLAKKIIGGIGTKELGGKEGTEHKQIIGEKGAKLIKDVKENFGIAEEMSKKGIKPKNIYLATGWEKGIDGKWRYDLIESKDDFTLHKNAIKQIQDLLIENDHIVETKLGELSPNAKIFKAYPELKNLEVVFYNKPNDEKFKNTNGFYAQKDDKIFINAPQFNLDKKGQIHRLQIHGRGNENDVYRLQSVIIHELQHKIQYIEGFDRGGNAKSLSLQRQFEQAKKLGILNKNYSDDEIAHEVYESISGEVEARNVQKRLNMTEKERKESSISETESISRENQVRLGEAIDSFDEANSLKGIKRNTAMKEFKQNFPTLAENVKLVTDNFKEIVNQLKQTQNLTEKC